MSIFFVRTVKDRRGETRVMPLPHQNFNDGTSVDITKHCAASRSVRMMYPEGTVFATTSLDAIGDTHYSAGTICPVSLALSDIKRSNHVPSQDMRDAWEGYHTTYPDWDAAAPTSLFAEDDAPATTVPKKEAKAAPKKETLLDVIRRRYGAPTIGEDGFYVDARQWTLLVRNMLSNVSTLLTGPSGTGKTELVMKAAQKLGYECCVYDMGSMHDPMTQMLGTHRIDADHKSVFDYAKFVGDVSDGPREGYEGRVVLLDELSRAPLNTLNILLPCLDSRRSLPVEMAGAGDRREVKVHPDVVFVATANVGCEYTGTEQIDKALEDRFMPLNLSFLPKDAEKDLLVARCGIGKADAGNIVEVCDTVRRMYADGTLSKDVSTRHSLRCAALVADGFTTQEALELSVLPLFEGTDGEGERSLVRKAFMTR